MSKISSSIHDRQSKTSFPEEDLNQVKFSNIPTIYLSWYS